MLGRELTLPVDLFHGATADLPHFNAIPEYVQDLEATMAKIREFARTNIKTLSNRAKTRYDLKASERLFNPVTLCGSTRRECVQSSTVPGKGLTLRQTGSTTWFITFVKVREANRMWCTMID